MVILQLSGYQIQLAENDLTLRKMTTKPSIIIWSILPKDVPVTCKQVFFTSCKIIKMVHYLLLLNTPDQSQYMCFLEVVTDIDINIAYWMNFYLETSFPYFSTRPKHSCKDLIASLSNRIVPLVLAITAFIKIQMPSQLKVSEMQHFAF